MKDIEKKVLNFYEQSKNDPHHRYKSWEHCYSYFSGNIIDEDIACLHLSFYLASWGMYRGSSFLLWKDYLIHKSVVKKLISVRGQFQHIDFSKVDDKKLSEIIELYEWIKDWYLNNLGLVNGSRKKRTPSPVLVTKILLGTLGCIPAYDRYFVIGLGKYHISPKTVTVKGLRELVNFYTKNKSEFDSLKKKVRVGRHPYPTMKLIDMYFWQIGSKKSTNNQ